MCHHAPPHTPRRTALCLLFFVLSLAAVCIHSHLDCAVCAVLIGHPSSKKLTFACVLSMQAVPADPDVATVWLLTSGHVLSVDSQFQDWFGHRPADLEGGATTIWRPTPRGWTSRWSAAVGDCILHASAVGCIIRGVCVPEVS